MGFTDWLMKEKGYTSKSARDVLSRLKRVQKLLNTENLPENCVDKLNMISEFSQLSFSVKSQLRRSVQLYTEYTAQK